MAAKPAARIGDFLEAFDAKGEASREDGSVAPEEFFKALSSLASQASEGNERREAEKLIEKREHVANILSAARSSKTPPAIKNLSSAVLAKDLESVAAWVAAGEGLVKRINFISVSMRADAERQAFQLAAAIGWVDGLILLRAFGRESWEDPQPSKRIKNSRTGNAHRVPASLKIKDVQKDGWSEDNTLSHEQRAYTALGFASINGHEEAAALLIKALGKKDPEGLPKNAIAMHALTDSNDVDDNAVVFAMKEMSIRTAKVLAGAGAGSQNLQCELEWAAKNSACAEAKMLISVAPKRWAMMGRVGPELLEMAIGKADVDLARMLVRQGVDSSTALLYGMTAAKALEVSREEWRNIVEANPGGLDLRGQRALAALVKEAPRKPLALAVESAEESPSPVEQEPNADAKPQDAEEPAAPEQSQALVADAIRELQGFDEIVSQMGLRIKALIKGLEAAGIDSGERPFPRRIGLEVTKMRERAEQASQAIAKASASARKEP